jgi:chromate transporter
MIDDAVDSPVWLLFTHLAMLSMMAIGGGVIMLAPDIHRYVVEQEHWITSDQFTAAFTIAQAAPGPNVLFVTLIGWQIAGLIGAVAATVGVVAPPSLFTLVLMRVSAHRTVGRFGRAVRTGLAPVSVGLLGAGGWLLVRNADTTWRGGLLTALAVLALVRTRWNPVWLILAGAGVGLIGLV